MEQYILILVITVVAGLVQAITGFGSGIVMMMVLPMLFTLPVSAGISTAISVFLCLSMVITYRKHVNFKKVVPPCALYILVCSLSIHLATIVDQALMKKVFGVFLILLSCYYLFIKKDGERKKLNLPVSILFIVISAMCDGMFGIGGPLMVVYFLSQTHNTYEYLGTIQTFFLINCVYNTCFRIYKGILLTSHLPIILIGMLCIVLGGMIGNKVVDRLDGVLIRKLVYIMIGISGLINII